MSPAMTPIESMSCRLNSLACACMDSQGWHYGDVLPHRQRSRHANYGPAHVNGSWQLMHTYEIRPRVDRRGFDLISDALPFGRLW
jgi:hypothetical protein